jgi:hypothetical protein
VELKKGNGAIGSSAGGEEPICELGPQEDQSLGSRGSWRRVSLQEVYPLIPHPPSL